MDEVYSSNADFLRHLHFLCFFLEMLVGVVEKWLVISCALEASPSTGDNISDLALVCANEDLEEFW